jgi:hypothetical protein
VVATIGEEWKRHRKITARTFSQKSIQLVHAETVKQTGQTLAAWEKAAKGDKLVVERYLRYVTLINRSIQSETNKLSLHVMAGAEYGYPLEWEGVGEVPEGHQMSFQDSIHATLDNIIAYVIVPRCLLRLPINIFEKQNERLMKSGST